MFSRLRLADGILGSVFLPSDCSVADQTTAFVIAHQAASAGGGFFFFFSFWQRLSGRQQSSSDCLHSLSATINRLDVCNVPVGPLADRLDRRLGGATSLLICSSTVQGGNLTNQ